MGTISMSDYTENLKRGFILETTPFIHVLYKQTKDVTIEYSSRKPNEIQSPL